MTHTHTYVILQVSRVTFDEIRERLLAAGYDDQVHETLVDMHGLAIAPNAEESEPRERDGSRAVPPQVERWAPCSADQQPAATEASTVFGCDYTSDDDPCPARVLYERAYQRDLPDLYGWMRFHHGWHSRDEDLARASVTTPTVTIVRDAWIAKNEEIERRPRGYPGAALNAP